MRDEPFLKPTGPSRAPALRLRRQPAVPRASSRIGLSLLPPEISFLASQNVPRALLSDAADQALSQNVTADRVLLNNGLLSERFFYQSLARSLGLPFLDEAPALVQTGESCEQTLRAGLVPIETQGGISWLAAPQGQALSVLLRELRRPGRQRLRLAITTPSNLSRWLLNGAARKITADASYALLSADHNLSAQGGATLSQRRCIGFLSLMTLAALALAPRGAATVLQIATGFLFLAAILFRLLISSAALGAARLRYRPMSDADLPAYSVIIALYKEARVVQRLVSKLERLDYPRAKLDIKFIIEDDDLETRLALQSLRMPPRYEIIVAPPGMPRTKPRALNVALPFLRGDLCVVFDAEDVPEAAQLRCAAAQFAAQASDLACLQARLSVENKEDSWLTQLFAIEYASLFHLQNIGLADLGLPIPVSGSSNHFRTSVLREIHGWDAWNVTEDADIGLRLARFGYRVQTLDSETQEEAPTTLKAWFGQRQRWYKGWLQTFVTLSRTPAQVVAQLGRKRSAAVILLFLGLLFGPLVWIPASLMVAINAARLGFSMPTGLGGICFATLWTSVSLIGVGSLLWHALIGMRRARIQHLWPALLLLLPYYCLHAAAAWMAVYDLFTRPFHWQKTEHGLARASQRVTAPASRLQHQWP